MSCKEKKNKTWSSQSIYWTSNKLEAIYFDYQDYLLYTTLTKMELEDQSRIYLQRQLNWIKLESNYGA